MEGVGERGGMTDTPGRLFCPKLMGGEWADGAMSDDREERAIRQGTPALDLQLSSAETTRENGDEMTASDQTVTSIHGLIVAS